jgi:hypothetical protein
MALSLKTQLLVESVATTAEGNASARDEFTLTNRLNWTDGTGASSANKQWNTYQTLGGSADSHDLTALTDRRGASVSFGKVRVLIVAADAGNAAVLTVGGGSNAWATSIGTITVRPGEVVFKKCVDATAWAVTGGTGDLLQVSGTSGDDYELYLAGE